MVVIGNKGMTETNINARALMLTESQIVGLLGPGSPEEGKLVLAGTVCVRARARSRACGWQADARWPCTRPALFANCLACALS